ncbi:MAG: zinc metalloprotease, partial [Sphingobacteriales bacterium]
NNALYEQEMTRLIAERRQLNNFGPPTVIYNIPVIFHIIYDGNTEATIGTGSNISNALVSAQIAQLNQDFADMAGSVYGVSEDMGVRFVAAKVDPLGNLICTPGVERINWRSRAGWSNPATLASNSAVQNQYNNVVKPQSIWDPYRYLNIWLADFEASGLLGYASFPGQSTLSGLDNAETDLTAGVVILSGSVGSVTVPGSAAPYDYGRTLTHELGHFFGLRHITGDDNCGDDFCGDTPPQSALTGGCPATGTLNNCTPSVPKMFENYMDYSNDACLNTFTLNQSERCQVVMLNSPRRKELPLSTAGNSPNPNRISFKSGVGTVSEAATGLCPRFRDYSLVLGVDVAANGPATVSLAKSGTATDNVDYSILQSSVTYTNGDAADKTFTLRVFDDAATETAETIILNIAITGTGVQTSAACPAVNQFTVTISDDDALLSINNSIPTPVLYTQDFGAVTGSNQLPSGWTFANGTSNTNNKWVGNSADAATYGFTGNTLHISNGNAGAVANGTAPMLYSNVAAGTDARAFSPIVNAQGLKNISVSFKLVCNGEFDQQFYDYGIAYYTLDGSNYSALSDINGNFILQGITTLSTVNLSLPAGVVGTSTFGLLFRWISDNSVANQPPFAIDDLNVTGTAVTVEAQANNPSTENIPSGAAVSTFYSTADGQIIAKIENSSANIGCVTANIATAGNGFTAINTTSGAYARSNKVITLNPAVSNTTASYRATFYFTQAELAAWGVSTPNLKLMKVANGVNLASTLTAANAQVVTTTFDDQLASRGYASYSGN